MRKTIKIRLKRCQSGLTAAVLIAFLSTSVGAYPAEAASVSVQKDVRYTAGNNARQKLDVYMPPYYSAKQNVYPAVILIHGGGWMLERKEWWKYYAQNLAERGFLVFVPNYRLAPEGTIPQMIEDATNALLWIVEHAGEYSVDRNRIGIIGSSAGGHLAYMLATKPETRQYIRAAVGFYGVTDLISGTMAGTTVPYPGEASAKCLSLILGSAQMAQFFQFFRLILGDISIIRIARQLISTKSMGGAILGIKFDVNNPVAVQLYQKHSPLYYAHDIGGNYPSFLIIQGKTDPVVDYSNAKRLHTLLSDAGADVRFFEVNSGHGFLELFYPLMLDRKPFLWFLGYSAVGIKDWRPRATTDLAQHTWKEAVGFLEEKLNGMRMPFDSLPSRPWYIDWLSLFK